MMDEKEEKQIARWRLILGEESRETMETLSGSTLLLTEEERLMDQALAAIYDHTSGSFGSLGAGKGPSNPQISKWLGEIRTLFDKELVTVIQNDAIDRCGLKQLLFEPELLSSLEPDIGLASMLLELKDQIPKRSKENVREFIRKIVEQINRLLAEDIKRSVTASLNKRRHTYIPSASALDFPYTIRKNLKNYNTDLKTIIPERCYFFDRVTHTSANRWTVIVDIDQSGSMGESVIYSSIMGCILSSMSSLKTHIVAFDTSVVDLTEKWDDPVDMLYGIQLGGGTDINKSVAYCEQFAENPKKTLFFLVSDLAEGGNQSQLLMRLKNLVEAGVTIICLLAIADGGKPYYDERMASRVAALSIPCFACNPTLLPELLAKAFAGQDLTAAAKEFEKRKN